MKKVTLCCAEGTLQHPTLKRADKECLVLYVDVDGHKAWTLWDSGSTTSGITPQFTHVYGISVQELDTPLALQLGTVGSRAMVQYGTNVNVQMPGLRSQEYMDVANFDRYDMILGTPFMRRNKVILDFDHCQVLVNGKVIPAKQATADDTDNCL